MDSEADRTDRAEMKGHTTAYNSHEFYKLDLMTDRKITTGQLYLNVGKVKDSNGNKVSIPHWKKC